MDVMHSHRAVFQEVTISFRIDSMISQLALRQGWLAKTQKIIPAGLGLTGSSSSWTEMALSTSMEIYSHPEVDIGTMTLIRDIK
jgi:16S rRNA G1207 methylase RsmC